MRINENHIPLQPGPNHTTSNSALVGQRANGNTDMSSSSSTSVLSFKINCCNHMAEWKSRKTIRSGGWRILHTAVSFESSLVTIVPSLWKPYITVLCSSLEEFVHVRVLASDVWLLTTGCRYHSPCAIHGNLFHLWAHEKMYTSSKRTEYNLICSVTISLLVSTLEEPCSQIVKLSKTQNRNSNWLMYLYTLSRDV